MSLADLLYVIVPLAVGSLIYQWGYGNGVASERARPVLGRVLREYAETEAAIRARDAAPTTKRAIPGEQPATSWDEDAS